VNSAQATDTLPDRLPDNPMHIADAWLGEATAKAVRRNPNAMMLATLGTDGQPSARIVLCKAFVPDPGYLVFHTNYDSRKGRELEANPRVAVVFHWDALGRQVRIEGTVVRSPAAESDSYFATRDPGSRLGAWGSDQSRPIGSRDALVRQIRERAAGLGVTTDGEPVAKPGAAIRRPPHWGGLRVWATAIELWLEGNARVHDRAIWQRQIVRADEHSFKVSPWTGTRLQP
jgi:pyridoxamine 5'-phosphate oxidase